MSAANAAELCSPLESHLENEHWLISLSWRKGAALEICEAAQAGDATRFASLLKAQIKAVWGGKKQQAKRRQPLQLLPLHEPILLGAPDVTLDPLGEVTHIELPSLALMNEVCLLLTHHTAELTPQQCLDLWRWLLQRVQSKWATAGSMAVEDAFNDPELLEFQLWSSLLFLDLKGGSKRLKATQIWLRKALAEAVDTDGTLHAQWLGNSTAILTALARITILSQGFSPSADEDSGACELWRRTDLNLLQSTYERWVSLLYPGGQSFGTPCGPDGELSVADEIAAALGVEKSSGLRRLLASWQTVTGKRSRISTWSLPDECHLSDWAKWASFRGSWERPVNLCQVRWHQNFPELSVVARDLPFLQGAWELNVAGEAEFGGEEAWACVSNSQEDDVAFVELQATSTTSPEYTVNQQVLLLRHEQCLILNEFVSGPATEFPVEHRLSVLPGWRWEMDSRTREAALEQDDVRVRVFPFSESQWLVDKAAVSLQHEGAALNWRGSSVNGRYHSLTLFDWAPKRTLKPADWSRLTVAEDGRAVPAEVAVAYRLRVGKSQWILYHAFERPEMARTVLGLHTGAETVFAKFEDGVVIPLLDVEFAEEAAES